jgi:hypothetical protein
MISKKRSISDRNLKLPKLQPKVKIGPRTHITPPRAFTSNMDLSSQALLTPKKSLNDHQNSSLPFLDSLIQRYSSENHVQFVDFANKVQRVKNVLFSWSSKRTYGNIPASRVGATLTSIGNDFYLFGGQKGDRLNELKCLNYERLSWSTINPVKDMEMPEPRDGHTTLAFRTFLVVYGGAGAFNSSLHTRTCSPLIHILDTQSLHWKIYKPLGRLADPRRNHGASILGNSMLIYGGINNNSEVLSDFQAVHLDQMQWFPLKFTKDSTKAGPRHSFSMTCVFHPNILKQNNFDIFNIPGVFDEDFTKKNSGIYIFGGMNDLGIVLNDLHLIQPLKKVSRTDKSLVKLLKIEPAGSSPLARYGHSAGVCGKFLVFVGGRNDSLFSRSGQSSVGDIVAFNVPCCRWESVDICGNVPLAVWGIASAVSGSRLLCFGGMSLSSFATNDLWVLETNQDTIEGLEGRRKENPIRMVIRRNTRFFPQ